MLVFKIKYTSPVCLSVEENIKFMTFYNEVDNSKSDHKMLLVQGNASMGNTIENAISFFKLYLTIINIR